MAMAAGLTLTNIYNSIVDAPAWGNQIPASLETARTYYRSSNPGDFFRIFAHVHPTVINTTTSMTTARRPISSMFRHNNAVETTHTAAAIT